MKKASNTNHRLRLTVQFSLLLALSLYLIGYMFYYAQVSLFTNLGFITATTGLVALCCGGIRSVLRYIWSLTDLGLHSSSIKKWILSILSVGFLVWLTFWAILVIGYLSGFADRRY